MLGGLTSVGIFVNNNASLKGTIAVWRGSIPNIHSHATRLPIWRSSKVGIIHARTILSVKDGKVIALTTLAPVVDLEVPCLLVEAEDVE